MIKISVHHYELNALRSLNSKYKKTVRQGALLRVKFEDGLIGYADCHPWDILGDPALEQQLNLLACETTTPMTAQSIHFARIDAQARKQKKNVFHGLSMPPSHYLLADLRSFEKSRLKDLAQQGFTRIKIKVGRDLYEEIDSLKKLIPILTPLSMKIRLDFNASITPAQFETFLTSLDLSALDFIEDPFPYDQKLWSDFQKKYPIQLACDAQSEQAIGAIESAKVLVIKPATQNIQQFTDAPQTLIVTSYMDHPLGQLGAAYYAAKFSNRVKTCGLMTHLLYAPNPFIDCLSHRGPLLVPPQGYGFGFDELLKQCEWQDLT